jgi:hypothetical protein
MMRSKIRRWYTVEWKHRGEWYPMDLRPTREQAREDRRKLVKMGSYPGNLRVKVYTRADYVL